MEEAGYPSVAVSGSFVHTVWVDERDEDPEIYYKRSTDNGSTWQGEVRLRSGEDAEHPSLTASGQYVHVVWTKDGEIYYKRSTDNGGRWGDTIRLTDAPGLSTYPSITASGSDLYLVWIDHRDGNPEVYYKRSTDNGVTWGVDIRLTDNSGNSICPSVTISGSCLHLLWSDNPDNNKDIYYKRNPNANLITDIGVFAIVSPSGLIDSGTTVTPACTVYNYGRTTAGYSVRMKVGDFYNQIASVSNHTPGTKVYLTFPNWIATQKGNHVVSCSTELLGDEIPENNKRTGSVFVRVRDVGVVSILYPIGNVSPGPVVPQARVCNYGNVSETFTARFSILQNGNAVYTDNTIVLNLSPGDSLDVDFAEWEATTGDYTARCSTYLAGDVSPVNDTASVNFVVQTFSYDVGVVRILFPTGVIQPKVVTPRAKIHNYGLNTESFWVYFAISTAFSQVYLDSVEITDLPPNTSREVSFSPWEALIGEYTTKCTVALLDDQNPQNNKRTGSVKIEAYPIGWLRYWHVPLEPDNRRIKSGGGMARCADRFYILKGNNTRSLYSYIPWEQSTQYIDSVPLGTSRKKVKKGSGITSDGRYLYIAKGNNTREFFRYDTQNKTWEQLEDVPPGNSEKNLRGGTGIAYLNGSVYLLKGSKTTEFWKYDTAAKSWSALRNAPEGTGIGKGYGDGSCLVAFNDTLLYLLRGKYNEFYMYNVNKDSWYQKQTMPYHHPQVNRKKKVKEGGAMTVWNGKIWAFKGGNTDEFWLYDPELNQWFGRDTMPKMPEKKWVKGGGSLATIAGVIWALKGNNTTSIWRYLPPSSSPAYIPRAVMPLQYEKKRKEVVDVLDGYEPQYSPSGDLITYFKEEKGYNRIYIQTKEGEEKCLTKIEADCEYPQWSPDGNSIVFQLFKSPF
ncbi:MAG: hypothetical protein ABIK94_01035 [candidate division WOR-3 bacterium]